MTKNIKSQVQQLDEEVILQMNCFINSTSTKFPMREPDKTKAAD